MRIILKLKKLGAKIYNFESRQFKAQRSDSNHANSKNDNLNQLITADSTKSNDSSNVCALNKNYHGGGTQWTHQLTDYIPSINTVYTPSPGNLLHSYPTLPPPQKPFTHGK